jgi:hypothetical protein
MASTVEKVKHALHLDKNHSTGTTHTHNTTTGHSGTAEGVAGPHSSRAVNAADPTVDSDLDSSRNAGLAHNSTTGHSGVGHTSHTTGTGVISTSGTASGYNGSTTDGPHKVSFLYILPEMSPPARLVLILFGGLSISNSLLLRSL